jgi:hypothetical protein
LAHRRCGSSAATPRQEAGLRSPGRHVVCVGEGHDRATQHQAAPVGCRNQSRRYSLPLSPVRDRTGDRCAGRELVPNEPVAKSGGGPLEPPNAKTVELGGIEPPSVKGSPAAIRPFPVRSVMATSGLGPLTPKCLPPVFPWGQRSFSPSAVFPCRPSLLLLPGCSEQAPPSPKGTRCVLFICLEN